MDLTAVQAYYETHKSEIDRALAFHQDDFDGIICLITDQTHPPWQTFSPPDPQLIHNIVAWLKRRTLEIDFRNIPPYSFTYYDYLLRRFNSFSMA